MKRIHSVGLVLAGLLVAACATMVDTAVGTAARGVGTAIGERAGAALVARMPASWSADMRHLYVSHVLSMAFFSGATMPATAPYAPGEWTRWRMSDEDGDAIASVMERGFLSREENGNEWWRAVLRDDEGQAFIVEALFTPEHDEVRRMRIQTPDDDELEEVPVREGTYGFRQPHELTPESLEGAVVGQERVTVPAGSFTARHVRFSSPGEGTMEWWLSDDVPGGAVRYGVRGGWMAELDAYGRDAQRELR